MLPGGVLIYKKEVWRAQVHLMQESGTQVLKPSQVKDEQDREVGPPAGLGQISKCVGFLACS